MIVLDKTSIDLKKMAYVQLFTHSLRLRDAWFNVFYMAWVCLYTWLHITIQIYKKIDNSNKRTTSQALLVHKTLQMVQSGFYLETRSIVGPFWSAPSSWQPDSRIPETTVPVNNPRPPTLKLIRMQTLLSSPHVGKWGPSAFCLRYTGPGREGFRVQGSGVLGVRVRCWASSHQSGSSPASSCSWTCACGPPG